VEREKLLRLAQTPAENLVWSRLRSAQLGFKFRRQHEMLGYIVDFVCIEKRLIVELDGSQHFDQTEYDEARTRAFSALGFRVLRFWNNDVLERTNDVLASIYAVLAEELPPHPDPLPRQRRGRGSRDGVAIPHVNPLPRQRRGRGSRGVVAKIDSRFDLSPSAEINASAIHNGSVGAGANGKLPLPQASLGERAGERGRHFGLRHALTLRASLYNLIRGFFSERGVLEVETPIMSAAANTDPNIESFGTCFSGHVDAGASERWLRTSSEFAQKRLLAAGIGHCYELGRVFRNGEAGRRHNPEFTMLEWYRVGWNHRQLIDETVGLVQAALALRGAAAEVRTTTYRDLFHEAVGLDPLTADDRELRDALHGVRVSEEGLGRDDRLDLLLTHRIQPAFPAGRITVVYDYPASQCALAKIRADDPPVAERFELYVGQHELANGYHELTDAHEQRARFERDNARRQSRGLAPLPLDENLLDALQALPDCAGVALGIERLLMAMTGSDEIRTVLAFPFDVA